MDELCPRTGVAVFRATPPSRLYRHALKGIIPGIMILRGIMFDQRAAFVYTDCSFTVECYVNQVILAAVLPLVQSAPVAVFQQDNALSHVAR